MKPTRKVVGVVVVCLALWSCQQESGPDSSPAEVPQPGPAAPQDPGPAPEGQSEPNLEDPAAPVSDPSASEEPPLAAPSGATEEETSEPGTTGDGSVSLQLQDWDATEKLIADHQGKVVVVDFWSTSCLPCRREFPHLVELQKAHPDEVACVSVSLDYSGRKSRPPESYRESVLEFLNEQQAQIDNVLSIDDPEELEQRLDLAPIPLVWVYDRNGKRRRSFDNADREGQEFTYEADVVPFVETLLAETSATPDPAANSAVRSVR